MVEGSPAAQVLRDAFARGELSRRDLDAALERLSASRRGPRSEGNGRRRDILVAATRVFANKGYHGATLQDVAGEVGLSRPTFYHYFKSKQEILEAICLAAADAADAVVSAEIGKPAGSPAAALRRTLLAYARHIAAQESTATMMRNFEEMSVPMQREIAERRRRREAKVLELVGVGIRAGELAAAEPKIAVLAAFEAINTMHNWYDRTGRLARDKVAEVLVDQILSGLLVRSS